MLSRKLLLVFSIHFLTAYVVGSQIYGFHGEPDKFIVLAAAGAVIVLTRYAKENMFTGARDLVLQTFQIVFALSSGGLGYSRDSMTIATSFLLLAVAVLICYVRVTITKETGSGSINP